jgi:hypothetical protein
MQKVQEVSLLGIKDAKFLVEEYESMGFYVEKHEDHLNVYWGKPDKPKKKVEEQEDKKPERRSKTERRLGKKFFKED